ncbi:MAG TPA: thioredoxin domain-containing protein, partial [Bradyrhizobium sp.]|nr:thioredoxin domain-containing protein [Bradyrhizobium sp.]
MKVPSLLTCAMAALALAACNKNKNDGGNGPAATNETVSITQANPPPGGTWADVVNATSAGGYMMGNPNAKVKLIEIGSLSCPHCKAFEDEGM